MALDTAIDMGRDGGGTITARDAYGFQLNYFTGDYKPVNTSRNPFPGHSGYIGAAYRPLYNGNISSMGVNIGQLNQPQLYNYEYDQLNRLVSMQAYRGFIGNSWSAITATTDHQEQITYDGNGNIVSYLRNGNTSAGKPLAMDNLGYAYNKDGSGNLINNKLRHVTDAVTAGNYTEDIDGQVADNYSYDQIGNLTGDIKEKIDSIEWNVYGKIAQIWKENSPSVGELQRIAYRYDASGNRISKTVYSNQDASNYKAVHTWYVRDASGNVMATYTSEDVAAKSTLATGTLGKLYLNELHMYGSSRLGIWNRKVDMDLLPASGGTAPLLGTLGIDTFNRGNKFFELANHLGNVLVTVSDRKVGQNPVSGIYTSYTADVVSASDYAPFGMQMVGRTYSAGAYRYGFNGKENDNEVKGEGNQQDYGMRIYDPRLGKFLSVDPLAKEFPWNSTYSYAEDDPINYIDIDGAENGTRTAAAIPRPTASQLSNLNVNRNGQLRNSNQNSTQLFTSGEVNSGSYAPQVRFVTQEELDGLIPPNGGAFINHDGISMTVFNSVSSWQVSLLKTIHKTWSSEKMTQIERAAIRLQDQQIKLFNTFTQWNSNVQAYEIITTDPSILTDEYLSQVQKRLISGNATKQDLQYQNELRKRKLLYELNNKHNPSKPSGGANASIIPPNHFELWENRSYHDSKTDTWWSVEGKGKKRVYHRFSNDKNGAYHWSGSTGNNNVNRKGYTVDGIPIREVPIELIRKK